MTRINAGILPTQLCDQHLLAEHYEILRLRHLKQTKLIPKTFVLGTGHMMFFIDKMGYIRDRYLALHKECLRRNFDVQDFSDGLEPFKGKGQYIPTTEGINLLRERLTIRLMGMKDIRYYGKKITKEESIALLY